MTRKSNAPSRRDTTMPSIRFSLCLGVVTASIGIAHAEDKKFSGNVFPSGDVSSSLKDTQLEVGLDVKWNNLVDDIPDNPAPVVTQYTEWQARVFGRVPVGDKDSTVAKIDRNISSARVGLKVTHRWDVPAAPRPPVSKSNSLALSAEYGFGRFEYFPNGNEDDDQKLTRHSVGLEATYVRGIFFDTGCQFVPQLRLRFDRGWKASDKVGVVIPGVDPAPATTKDLVIAAPTVAPELSARFAMPLTTGTAFGIGPSLKYTLTGNDGDVAPGGKNGRLRVEWFLYWFPASLKGGGRIGISPFVDIRTHGTDKLRQVEYGGLIDLRIGTNLLEY